MCASAQTIPAIMITLNIREVASIMAFNSCIPPNNSMRREYP